MAKMIRYSFPSLLKHGIVILVGCCTLLLSIGHAVTVVKYWDIRGVIFVDIILRFSIGTTNLGFLHVPETLIWFSASVILLYYGLTGFINTLRAPNHR